MLESNEMKFADTIGVTYALKDALSCKTVQDVFKKLETSDLDMMLLVLTTAFNVENKACLSPKDFLELLDKKRVGYVKIGMIYRKLIENISFDGLTDEERKELQDQAKNLVVNPNSK
jgi:hypothetical protein